MKTIVKLAGAATLAGVLAFAAASPSQARNGAVIGAAAGGFVAGAAIGAAAANNNYYGGPGYYGPGYGPGYAYDTGYYDGGYAYAPAPRYYRSRGCWHETDGRGYGYYGAC